MSTALIASGVAILVVLAFAFRVFFDVSKLAAMDAVGRLPQLAKSGLRWLRRFQSEKPTN